MLYYCISTIGESFFRIFAQFTYAYHCLMKLIKQHLWILKEHKNFNYLFKFEPDIPKSFREILLEKNPKIQRMYELINVLPPSNFAVFDCCYFLCCWLKRVETCTNCSNQPALSIFEPNLCISLRLLCVN